MMAFALASLCVFVLGTSELSFANPERSDAPVDTLPLAPTETPPLATVGSPPDKPVDALSSAPSIQSLVIQGQIVERGTVRPLAEVNVFALPAKVKSTTDATGAFSIAVDVQAEAGNLNLVVNLTGYSRLDRALTESEQQRIQSGERVLNLGRLYLEKIQYSGFETVIVGKTKKRDDQERILKADEFLVAPGANRDPVKAIQNLPGVNRPNGFSSQIIIQGSEPEDTRYNIEGHAIPLIFHFGGLSSVLYPDSIDSVSLLGAGYGPEFSQALGGHIGLRTKTPRQDAWSGQGYIDIFNVGAMIEGPISQNSSLLGSARYSYIGTVLERVARGRDDFQLTAAPNFGDASLIYETRLSESEKLKVIGLASKDEVQLVVGDSINNDPALRGNFSNDTQFFRLIGLYSKELGNQDAISFSMAVGRDELLFDIGENFFRLGANRMTTRGEYLARFTALDTPIRSYTGWDNDYTWFNIGTRLPATGGAGGVGTPLSVGETRSAEISGTNHQLGLYNRTEIQVSDHLMLTPGLRADRFQINKETVIQPRFAASFKPNRDTSYRFASGVYHQAPSGQQASRDFGNPDVLSQRAVHLNIGFEHDFRAGESDGHVLGVGGFYKALDRLIIRSQKTTVRDGVTQLENFNNDGLGTIYGSELAWKYRSGAWLWGANYTYARSVRVQPGQNEFPAPFDQTHNLILLATYSPDRWVWTSRFRYVSGNPFTPVVGSSFDADNDVYVPIRGPFFSERRSDFMQLDLRGEYRWIYDTWILAFYFDIQNILNQQNVETIRYSFDYSERQDVMGLGLLPTLGVRGEF